MNKGLEQFKRLLNNNNYEIRDYKVEPEGKAYAACQFTLNRNRIICRTAKQTPKKIGQFVTFWKRDKDGVTVPFHVYDRVDFFIVLARTEKDFGHFAFPKSILIEKEILSTDKKIGKRGFRVYPPWEFATNKQATQTQKWQLEFFHEMAKTTNLKKALELNTEI